MWSRQLTSEVGMDEKKFTQALSKALDSDVVVKKLSSIITAQVVEIVKQMSAEMRATFEESNNEIKSLIQKHSQEIKEKNEEIKQLKNRIQLLENSSDELEQYSRRNSVRIFGLPEHETSVEEPMKVVLELFNENMKMEQSECQVMPTDIDRVHRVGPKHSGKSRPMLVKFTHYGARMKVFQAKRKNKPTTTGTMSTTPSQIFINEDLTKTRVNLLYQARKAKKEKRIKDCWTFDGTVLIKDNSN